MNPDRSQRGAEPAGAPARNPWIAVAASTAVHAVIALALVGAGLSAMRAARRQPVPVLASDWVPPPPSGLAPAPPELPVPGGASAVAGPAARGRTDDASAARAAADRLARAVPGASAGTRANARIAAPLGIGAQAPERFLASSFGLDRRRVAFVVDAGGRLLATLPAARATLAQRLAALTPDQEFTIAVCRGGGTELAPGTPAAATRQNVAAALRWFTDAARPGGTADLGAALRRIWQDFEPDAVCVIARGSARARRDAPASPAARLAAEAGRLNPADDAGRRHAAFLCIELADASPDGALRALGEEHGGAKGYLFLDREALGIAPPRPRPAAPGGKTQ